MKYGRTTIICKSCKRNKLHYGLGMCSACLRNHKRKTRPSFYLGTCYSEISRRVKTYDPSRPNYFGLPKCTREEFIDRFVNGKEFLRLFKNWKKKDFQRKYAPSIDRINNSLGYTLDNIEFIPLSLNAKKDWQHKTKIIKDREVVAIVDSKLAASRVTQVSSGLITKLVRSGKPDRNGYCYVKA